MLRFTLLVLLLVYAIEAKSVRSPIILAATCATRADCSNHGDCVNSECVCDGGWVGVTCGAPFCASRGDCSNHGNCVNAACACDAGFQGSRCEASACNLQCQHGGVPDAACSTCTGCLGAWTGPLCADWNSAAGLDVYTNLLAQISATAADDTEVIFRKSRYPPLQGSRAVGFTYDRVSGQTKTLPLYAITFMSTTQAWVWGQMSYAVPDSIAFTAVCANAQCAPQVDTQTFQTIGDFYNKRQRDRAQGLLTPSTWTTDISTTHSEHFAGRHSASLGVAQYKLFTMALPNNGVSMALSRFATRALAALPNMYTPETKSIFRLFISQFGTHVITQASYGGYAVLSTRYPTCLAQTFDANELARQVRNTHTHTRARARAR
eukprot:Colp12_sorted_trinity150504_noHs@19091